MGQHHLKDTALNYALSRREERHQIYFGICGINQPFDENSCNIFKYEYKQDNGTRQYLYCIKNNVMRGGVSNWSSRVKHTPISSPLYISSPPSLQLEVHVAFVIGLMRYATIKEVL